MATSTTHISGTVLERLRLLLLEERTALAGSLAPVGDGGEVAGTAADELDGLRYEQGVRAAVATHNRTALADVDAALARMDDGSYGACLVCGAGIPVERLEALPAAGCCVACQHSRE
jgi:DnaK suppressor protein